MVSLDAQTLISQYQLQPHIEGGYFKELFRTSEYVKVSSSGKERTFGSSIMFLLPGGSKSSLHRLKSAETWHFYHGDHLNLLIVNPEGVVKIVLLGSNLEAGHHFQYTVEAGSWFGSYMDDDSNYALVGCSVYPAFEWEDFELATMDSLPPNLISHSSVRNLIKE